MLEARLATSNQWLAAPLMELFHQGLTIDVDSTFAFHQTKLAQSVPVCTLVVTTTFERKSFRSVLTQTFLPDRSKACQKSGSVKRVLMNQSSMQHSLASPIIKCYLCIIGVIGFP